MARAERIPESEVNIATIPFEVLLATDIYPKCYQLIKFTQ